MANIEELAKVDAPKIPKTGSIGFQEALGIQEPYLTRKAQLQTEIGKATEEETLAKQRQQEGLAEAKAGVQETYAGAEKAARAGLQEKLAEEPLPEFIPTKDTVNDIAGLFSLIGVIGMIAGKQNAMQALSAMNGMLEGHSKGRLELYRQERDTFDKNFRAMLKKHEEFRKEMEDAIKTAATDKEAGMAKAELAAVKANSPIAQAMLRKGQLVEAVKFVDDSQKAAQNAFAIVQRISEKAADRAAAMQRTQMQITAADARARLKAEAPKTNKGLKPSAKVTEGYIADNQLKADVDDILADLKKPGLAEKLKQYRIEAFLTEEGKVLNQLVNEDIPSDLRQFLTKVRDVRNNYYLNISGKAVTGGEALRNYGTVPQPGDSPESMVDKLQGMSNRINQSIASKRQVFPGLPELRLTPGSPTMIAPGDDYSARGKSQFNVGTTYTDASGNKAKYMGTDNQGQDIWEEVE